MTKQHTFFIRDETLTESEKLQLRQNLTCSFSGKKNADFQELFCTDFPIQEVGEKNCENLIGSISVPVGIAGPVTVQTRFISHDEKVGKEQQHSFVIPLATTEGALVASIHRGTKVLNAGQTKVIVKKIGMSRSVVFECGSIDDSAVFIDYFSQNSELFGQFCEETSTHLKFLSYEVFMRDKLLYFRFVFDTDEAMGMNMVTIALSYAWDKFKRQLPDHIWVSLLTVSGNVCTDKKDSMINRLRGRGYFVTAETIIPVIKLEELLKVRAQDLVKTHLVKNVIGSNVAGSFAQNMHVANALGAFYLATGQDIAHVVAGSEASVHFELVEDSKLNGTVQDFLYVALTLPNVSVGSVGGGTWLPKQTQARLAMLSGDEENGRTPSALDLATCAGLASLAGEISGLAALTTHTLASAHAKLGRLKKVRK